MALLLRNQTLMSYLLITHKIFISKQKKHFNKFTKNKICRKLATDFIFYILTPKPSTY